MAQARSSARCGCSLYGRSLLWIWKWDWKKALENRQEKEGQVLSLVLFYCTLDCLLKQKMLWIIMLVSVLSITGVWLAQVKSGKKCFEFEMKNKVASNSSDFFVGILHTDMYSILQILFMNEPNHNFILSSWKKFWSAVFLLFRWD